MKEAGAFHLEHLRLGEPGRRGPDEPGLAAHQGERQVHPEVVRIIVVAPHDRERQPVLGEQGIKRLESVGPLAVILTAVDDIAEVGDEHDVLVLRVREQPVDLLAEFDPAPRAVALRVRENGDDEGPREFAQPLGVFGDQLASTQPIRGGRGAATEAHREQDPH